MGWTPETSQIRHILKFFEYLHSLRTVGTIRTLLLSVNVREGARSAQFADRSLAPYNRISPCRQMLVVRLIFENAAAVTGFADGYHLCAIEQNHFATGQEFHIV